MGIKRSTSLRGKICISVQVHKPKYHNLKVSDLKDEFPKAQVLAKKGLCDIYILITNAGVSGTVAGKIEEKLKSFGIV